MTGEGVEGNFKRQGKEHSKNCFSIRGTNTKGYVGWQSSAGWLLSGLWIRVGCKDVMEIL